jgi:protein-tyrosine phosphatase
VTVETTGPGALDVSWQLDGPDAPLDLAVGTTPEGIDHVHTRHIEPGTTSVRLTDLPPGRLFVSVSVHGAGGAVVAADRRLVFEGLQNFRDIGGYPATDGTTTRWGLVFRSDSLHKLTPVDHDEFERLGMRTVYDLRGDDERATNPNPFDAVHLAIVGQAQRDRARAVADGDAEPIVDGERMLRDLYVGMLEHSSALFGRLIGGLVDRAKLPAVFHCHAGKDRTGVAAALLLLALGVDRELVLDDYELTRRYRTFEHQQDSYSRLLSIGLTPEAAAGVLTAPRWAMRDTLDALDTRHGGIEAYLTGAAGMTRRDLQRLRATLTEPRVAGG